MSGERSSISSTVPDGEAGPGPDDGLNPFSFKEFLRWKALDPDPDPDHGPHEEREPEQAHGQEAEETAWGRSLQLGVDSTASTCTEEEEEEEPRFSRTAAGDEFRPAAGAPTSWRGRSSGRSTEVTQLQEENVLLRRTIRELQKRSEVNEHRLLQLSEELVHRRHQEEEEAQHLETMVQSVEQNLCLMTRRAARAESSVSRLKAELQQLKAELQQLQAEIGSLRSENKALKTAESEVVMTMRHNAKMASEHLNTLADHAHCSLRQLMGEAETLHLVSQLLQSIDKISQVHPES